MPKRQNSWRLLAACLAFAAGLHAQFETEISGKVIGPEGAKVEGAVVEVEPAFPDHSPNFGGGGRAPRWVHWQPKHDVKGQGKADAAGAFRFSVSIDHSAAARAIYGGAKVDVPKQSALAVVVVRCAGHTCLVRRITLIEGEVCKSPDLHVSKADPLKGRVLDPDGQPVPGLKMQLLRRLSAPTQHRDVPPHFRAEAEFTTKGDGRFELAADKFPLAEYVLRVAEGDWALPMDSVDWTGRPYHTASGDLGDLRVVPAGRVKAAILSEDETGARVYFEFRGGDQRASVVAGFAQGGVLDTGPIPECAGALMVEALGGRRDYRNAVAVTKGRITDLGSIDLTQSRAFEATVVNENGEPLSDLEVLVEPVGEVAAMRRQKSDRDVSKGKADLGYLAAGKWRLTVRHDSNRPIPEGPNRLLLLPVSAEVEVPRDKTVLIKVPLGAAMDVRILEVDKTARGFEMALAAPTGTDAAKTISEIKWDGSNLGWEDQERLRKQGALTSHGPFNNLKPGAWDIVVLSRELGLITGSADLAQGKITPVDIELEPGTLRVRLTEKGQKLPGRTLYVLGPGEHGGWQETPDAILTDANGEITVKSVFERKFVVLAEHEWKILETVRAAGSEAAMRNIPSAMGHRIKPVKYGSAESLDLEIHDPQRVIVRVTVKPPAGFTVSQRAMWLALDAKGGGGGNAWSELAANGDFYFFYVHRGKFAFTCELLGGNEPFHVRQEFTSGDGLIEEFTIEPRVKGLTVHVKLPAALIGATVYVGLEKADEPEPGQPEFRQRGASLKDKLSTFFAGVPTGTYTVWARIVDQNDRRLVQHAQSTEVSIDGNADVTLAIAENTGIVEVTVIGNPALGGVQPAGTGTQWALAVAFGSDADGHVEPGDPSLCRGTSLEAGLHVPSLPAGTYELILVARGLQPWISEVTVEAGKTTKVVATPYAAGILLLDLNQDQVDAIKKADLSLRFEDAAGERVSSFLPGGPAALFFRNAREQTALLVHNLHEGVAQVRILAKGHEDVVIKVSVQPGKTLVGKYELKPKAD